MKQVCRVFLYLLVMSIVARNRRIFVGTLLNIRICTRKSDLDIKEVINIGSNITKFFDVLAELEVRVVQDEVSPTVTTSRVNKRI